MDKQQWWEKKLTTVWVVRYKETDCFKLEGRQPMKFVVLEVEGREEVGTRDRPFKSTPTSGSDMLSQLPDPPRREDSLPHRPTSRTGDLACLLPHNRLNLSGTVKQTLHLS